MFKRISFSLHDVIFMRIMFVCMFMCAYRLHAVFHVIYADTFSTGKAVSTKSTPVLHVTVVPFQWKMKIQNIILLPALTRDRSLSAHVQPLN